MVYVGSKLGTEPNMTKKGHLRHFKKRLKNVFRNPSKLLPQDYLLIYSLNVSNGLKALLCYERHFGGYISTNLCATWSE